MAEAEAGEVSDLRPPAVRALLAPPLASLMEVRALLAQDSDATGNTARRDDV